MTEEQFYKFWEKFATSNILDSLPEDVEEQCAKLGITVDYYLAEFV